MRWLNRFKESLEYSEDNLHGDIDHNIVAQKTCLSKFYYYRMFRIVTGLTLGEYIRNRRMSLAAKDLKKSDLRIIDIAIDYGYGSQEAFSRAFKSVHGISPSQAKKPGINLKAYPPISFQLQLKGDVEMDYKILKKDKIKLIGESRKVSTEGGQNLKQIPLFWTEVMKDGTFDEILKLTESETYDGSFGICMEFDTEGSEFEYIIGVASPKKSAKFSNRTVPAGTYAVFGPVSLDDIQPLWKRIFSEWLPATDYEIANGPQVEYYPNNEDDKCTCEVWIPVKK